MTDSPRYLYIDYLRALAIIGVIVIHTFYPFNVDASASTYWSMLSVATLFRFSVPLYAMISGALLLSKPIPDVKEFYSKKLFRIGLPLLVWMIIYSVFDYFNDPTFILSERILRGILFGQPLYFLFVIAGLYAITTVLQKIVKALSSKDILMISIGCLGLTTLVASTENWLLASTNTLPHFSFNFFLYYLGYYLMGYVLHTLKLQINTKLLSILFISSLLVTLFVTHTLVGIYGVGYKAQVLFEQFSPTVMIMTLSLFGLFKHVESKLNRNTFTPLVLQISKYSLGIYFVHLLVLGILSQLELQVPNLISQSLLFFSLSLVISIVTVFIGRRLKLGLLLGI